MLAIVLLLLLNSVLINSKTFQISMPLITVDLNKSTYFVFENNLSGNFSNMFIKGNIIN